MAGADRPRQPCATFTMANMMPDSAHRDDPPHAVPLVTLTVMMITIATLYIGRDIFIPLALAVLLAFVMTPPVQWLRRIGVPRIAAIAVVLTLAFSAIGAVLATVGSQAVQLAENLPTYQRNIKDKLVSIRDGAGGSNLVERVTGTLSELGNELSPREKARPAPTPGATKREPVPVVVESGPVRPWDVIWSVLSPLIGPIGTAALVLLFTIFVMIEREELRDRFIKLVSGGDLQRSTEAITEAGQRVSRYLLMQLIVNATYGIPIGVGLWLIGVPNAALWGVLAAVLRFIPYIGPWVAALFPLALAFGVDPGWSMLAAAIALFVVVELVSNNVIEPWLYGSSTGLSSFAIILAAIFWTLLWGPVGLFLATPITVCLVVIGRYVPSLEFLGVVLGSDPVLSPPERLYQRLLSGNEAEAIEIGENYVEERSVQKFYEEVALPALRLAANDRSRSSERSLGDGMIAVIRELAETKQPAHSTASEPTPSRFRVLCIAGQTELDSAAAELVAARLQAGNAEVRLVPALSVSRSTIGQLDMDGFDAYVLCYLNPRPQAYARFVCRRLELQAPLVKGFVCCLNLAGDLSSADLQHRLGSSATVLTTLAEVDTVIAKDRNAANAQALPQLEQEALNRLHQTGFVTGAGAAFERIADKIKLQLGSQVILIAPIDETCLADPDRTVAIASSLTLRQMLCGEVFRDKRSIVVENVAEDKRFANNPELLEKGIRFFAAAPIRTSQGFVFAALCILGSEPRQFLDPDRVRLEAIADEVSAIVASGELEFTDAKEAAQEVVSSEPVMPVMTPTTA